jgi:hypothetical protein
MRILLDTNPYRDFCEGEKKAVDVIQRARVICLPFVVLAELRAGFLCGTLALHEIVRALAKCALACTRGDVILPHGKSRS